jgi:phosphate transport system substrate-binding protein
MNDDFLHRIRVEAPAGFLARLKVRLDRQPTAPPAPRRSLFRVLAIGLLFSGSVFAITLLTVNGVPDFARNFVRGQQQQPATATSNEVAAKRPLDNNRQPSLTTTQSGPGNSDPASQNPGLPQTSAASAPKNSTTATTQINSAAQAGLRPTLSLITPKALEGYTTSLFVFEGGLNSKLAVKATDTTTEALAAFCGVDDGPGTGAAKTRPLPPLAIATRRITHAEFEVCTNSIGNIAEVEIGHQAIVLARSKLYGAFALTPTEVFLALAAEIPDPAHSGKLIENPNKMWSDVNSGLENEPIEVLGPGPSSAVGVAFREIILEAGCNALPTMVALKQTSLEKTGHACKALRTDGAYVEMPDAPLDTLSHLQLRPNAMGILGYSQFARNANVLAASPLGGVTPTPESIGAGTFPGSRTLYLYVNQARSGPAARYLVAEILNTGGYQPGIFAIIPPDAPQTPSSWELPAKLPDLKL